MWVVVVLAGVLMLAVRKDVMAFAIKVGVSGTIRNEMLPALDAVQKVWARHGLMPPTITSIEDGDHKHGSLHYKGLAHDYRLNTIVGSMHDTLREEVAALLGSNFDVIHEYHGETKDHLHVEFDPKV